MFICAITEYFQGELVGDGSFRALAWCSHSCCHSALIWTKQRKTKWKQSKKAEPHQPNPKKPNQGRIAQFLGMTLSETGPSSWFWKHQLQFLNSCIILSLVSPLFNKNQGQSESLWAHSAEGSGTPWLTFPIAQWLTGRTGRDLGKPSPCPSSLCRWMMLWSGSEPSPAVHRHRQWVVIRTIPSACMLPLFPSHIYSEECFTVFSCHGFVVYIENVNRLWSGRSWG